MKACYIIAGADHWPELAVALRKRGVEPKMWISSHFHDDFAREHFKDCTVYPYLATTRGQTLYQQEIPYSPPAEMLTSPEFMRLKDQVYKTMDRQDDFGVYRRLEREAVFYSLFSFFYSELKKNEIEFVFATEGCHEPAPLTLYGVAGMMGIERRHFDISMVAPLMVMRAGFNRERIKIGGGCGEHASRFKEILHTYVDGLVAKSKARGTEEPLYMTKQKISDSFFLKKLWLNTKGQPLTEKLAFIKRKAAKLFKPYYTVKKTDFLAEPQRPTPLQAWKYKRNRAALKRKLKNSYLALALDKQPPLDTPYVYAPLHYEPERTTNPDGCEFYNQIDAIVALRDFVPKDIPIYIKEHYSQFTAKLHGHRGKSLYFYRLLAQLPNVKLLPMGCNSLELAKNAEFTASITGTSCLEAAILGKKSVIFGQVWFSGCPNVHHFSEQKSYQNLLKKKHRTAQDVKAFFNDLVDNYAVHGYVSHTNEPHWKTLFPTEQHAFLDGGVIIDNVVAALEKSGAVPEKARKLRKKAG